jgi:fructokinase
MTEKIKKPKIIGIGEVVFDILPDRRKLGGAPVDFLRHTVKNGAEGCLISAIGADDLGREVISELKKFEISHLLSITPYPTGRVLIFNNPSNGYTAHILENAAWDYIPFTEDAKNAIQKTDALYFGTLALRKPYSQGTILDLIDEAPETCYKFFDVNLRQNYYNASIIEQLLKRANILKLNIEELKILTSLFKLPTNIENSCMQLKEKYDLKYVLFTNGTKESQIFGDDVVTKVQNPSLEQAFSYGAGNAFAGAFISSILRGCTQQEAHQQANNTAVEVCLLNQKQSSQGA